MKTIYTLLIALILVISLTQFVISDKTIEVDEGDLVSLKLTTYDEDGDRLNYSFSTPLDEEGKWQTEIGDYGEYDILITVTDGQDETSETLTLIVNKVNRAPEIRNLEDIIVTEGTLVEIEPLISDEEDDKLTITISEPVGNDGEWQTSFEDAGEYEILVTASDETHTVSKSFKLIIEDINRDPVINEFYPEEDEIELEEGESIEFKVDVEDPDEDSIEYLWKLNNEEVSKENVYLFQTDYESAGRYIVRVEVSDDDIVLAREWGLNVNGVNRAPSFGEMHNLVVNEGELVILEISAQDPDGDQLFYKVSQPIGKDLEWQTGYDDAGEYEIEIEVFDGELTKKEQIYVTVKDVDRSPLFKKIEDININENDKVTIELKAQDPDGDKVEFIALGLPEGASLNGDDFEFVTNYWTVYKPGSYWNKFLNALHLDGLYYKDYKTFEIEFEAKGKEESTKQKVKITVNNVNRAPEIEIIEDIIIQETDKVQILPVITDADNDRISFDIIEPFDKNEWQTGYNDSGKYPLKVYVSDGQEVIFTEFNLIVENKNRLPEFETIKPIKTKENEEITIIPEVFDPDGNEVRLMVENNPEGATFEDGVFKWKPNFDTTENVADKEITFVALDGNETVKQTALVTVEHVNRLPILLNATKSGITAYIDEPMYFAAEPFDYDGDTLDLRWKFGVMDWVKGGNVLKRTFTSTGQKSVKLLVDDGTASITKEWQINVVERPRIPSVGKKITFEIDNKQAENSGLQFALNDEVEEITVDEVSIDGNKLEFEI